MSASWISCRLALRVLCSAVLLMALLDVPVAVEPETGWRVAIHLLLGALAGTLLYMRTRAEGSEALARAQIRGAARAARP